MKLSPGNHKLGQIPNISLPPIKTCKGCETVCGPYCYANRFYRMYPDVRNAWDHNLEHAERDLTGYFEDIRLALTEKIIYKFFRWHVGGDIISPLYFYKMVVLAENLPEINFLVFTKQYDLINAARDEEVFAKNLQVVFSAWPGKEMINPHGFKVAWLQNGKETRIPESAIECPGACDSCGMCWQLDKLDRDVVFDLRI